jgi:DNA polymerase elongation subunit (family B)
MTKGFYTSIERYGNNILWRGYENGKRFSKKVLYKPTLFVSTKNETEHRSLSGDLYLEPRKFDSMSDAKDFVERYKDVHGIKIFGNTNYVSAFIHDNYPGHIRYDMSLINIVMFDIEYDTTTGYTSTDEADKPINSIAFKSSKSSDYHLLTLKDYDRAKTITGIDPSKIRHMAFDTELALLRRFVQIWTNDYPDIVTGWNVEYFDIMYIVTRITKLFGEEKARQLSPWGNIRKTTREIFGKQQSTYSISGVAIIDYMDAFKKFGYKYGPQESYKLDHIAHVILGEKKLDYSEYGSLSELYIQNPQLFFDYNLKDTHLIELMEEETALLSLVMTVAYGGGVNYSDAFGTVGIWETTLYRKLMDKNIVPPIKSGPGERGGELVGGYVKDPKVGMHSWVVSFDLNSLYPHLMLQYNMSPETYLQNQREYVSQDMVLDDQFTNTNKDYSVCANGVCFSNKKLGIIPEIIEEYYANRKKIKQEMLSVEQNMENEKDKTKKEEFKRIMTQLHNSQMAIKIAMNSLYGATANVYFLYYIAEMAEAITTSGQLSIRYAQKSVNAYLNKILKTKDEDYIVYIDTDSIYVDMSSLVKSVFGTVEISRQQGEEFLDKVCHEKIEKVIAEGYEKLAKDMGAYRNAMSMKREKITDRAIFVAKKRYILNALNSEGVHFAKPKISVTGIESVRSSTPEVCRNKMKEAFEVIMNGSESAIQEFVEEFRKEFYQLPAEEVAKISGTDNIEKYIEKGTYKKGCPMHVRGCIVYNQMIKDKKLEKRYQLVQSGDKIKFVYMKVPNPSRENMISFPNVLPKELGLNSYIDYKTQYEKVFLSPIEGILHAIGWEATKTDTLESFFG